MGYTVLSTRPAAAELFAVLSCACAAALSQGCNQVSCAELHDPGCWIPPAEAGSDADGAPSDAPADVDADATSEDASTNIDAEGTSEDGGAD